LPARRTIRPARSSRSSTGKIANPIELALDADDVAPLKQKLQGLRSRRARLKRDLAISGANLSAQEIRNLVAAKMLSLRATLSNSPANA